MGAVRVMVVDDSSVVRRVITDALRADPGIEIVGTAANGRIAVEQLAALNPDILTMDIEMPVMDGIAAVRTLRRAGYRQPVIMFSTLTEHGAQATFDALAAGATDYLTKPSQVSNVQDSIDRVRASLIPLVRALVPRRSDPIRPVTATPAPPVPATPHPTAVTPVPPVVPPQAPAPVPAPAPSPAPTAVVVRPERVPPAALDVIAVGCSTGGPQALSVFLSGLPADLNVPVVVVQHMPAVFTAQFAQRLDRQLPLRVVEAALPEALRPGTVYIAPGDHHLEIHRRQGAVWTRTTQAPPENFCRPAVDVMLRSAVATYGNRCLGVIMTGMGVDGRRGCEDLVRAGGRVLAQDQATSVVWGMPGAVATAGLADEVLPLGDLAPAVRRRLNPVGVTV